MSNREILAFGLSALALVVIVFFLMASCSSAAAAAVPCYTTKTEARLAHPGSLFYRSKTVRCWRVWRGRRSKPDPPIVAADVTYLCLLHPLPLELWQPFPRPPSPFPPWEARISGSLSPGSPGPRLSACYP